MIKRANFLFANRKAFTLIEVLIVIAISAILSTIVITYSNTSRNEISVSVEAAKISQTIFQAKTLAIATYGNSSSSCGYGVSFNYASGTYSIFAYDPSGVSSCPDSATVAKRGVFPSAGEMVKYSDATWNVPVARGVLLEKQNDGNMADGATLILFYPPSPATFISRDDGPSSFLFPDPPLTSSNIYLSTEGDASASEVISVNSAGQITF